VSGTPRTDAKIQFFGFNPEEGEEFVTADFARDLESENAALKKEFRQAIKQVNTLSREAAHFEGKCKLKTQLLKRTEEEVAALKADKERLTWLLEYISAEGTRGLKKLTWSLYDDAGERMNHLTKVCEDDVADMRFDRAAIDAARAKEGGAP
jgi:hypothetical protein